MSGKNVTGKKGVRSKQAEPATLLSVELAIAKMRHDNMMALAKANPRDHTEVLSDLKSQLETYKSFATCITYIKPVGIDHETGQMKYVQGLTIRAAEALKSAFGFCAVSSDVVPLDDNTVKVSAMFSDYQSGNEWNESRVISKLYVGQDGGTRRHPDEYFYSVVVRAEVSVRVRECILRNIPAGLKSELIRMADEVLEAHLDSRDITQIVKDFDRRGVSRQQIESVMGKACKQFTQHDRKKLLGIANAIADGETTKHAVFGEERTASSSSKRTNAKPQTATERLSDRLTGLTSGCQDRCKKRPARTKATKKKAAKKAAKKRKRA